MWKRIGRWLLMGRDRCEDWADYYRGVRCRRATAEGSPWCREHLERRRSA